MRASRTIKRQHRHCRLSIGRATANLRSLPGFLIIGAQKCGTTSLFRYLIQHPHVAKPIDKEIHYFDLNFQKGLSWYRSFFPLEITHALHLKVYGSRLLVGEATPFYLFDPLIPRRVKEVIPNARLIVLIRDPVERAFSHYQHLVRRTEFQRTFRRAIEEDLKRGSGWNHERDAIVTQEDLSNIGVVTRGYYAEQLERWLEVFPREQILVVKSEDLFRTPQPVLDSTLKFLRLDDFNGFRFAVYNRGNYPDRIDPETRELLEAIYAPHNAELNQLVGVSF